MSKPSFEKVTYSDSYSFKFTKLSNQYFESPWHFHPEFELVLITSSYGKRFVGDHCEPFVEDDLVFIGSNLPHVWLNDKKFFEGNEQKPAEGYVIQLPEQYFPGDMLKHPELYNIRNLLMRAARGIRITGKTCSQIKKNILQMDKSQGMERYKLLLTILDCAGESNESYPLASMGYCRTTPPSIPPRLEKVYQYVMQYYQDDISVGKAADIACMNKSSFCRFFKSVTKKSFTEFVNEIRIGYACKLLIDGKFNITGICYECGFNNLSNFNRQFRRFTGKTPQEYKKQYRVIF